MEGVTRSRKSRRKLSIRNEKTIKSQMNSTVSRDREGLDWKTSCRRMARIWWRTQICFWSFRNSQLNGLVILLKKKQITSGRSYFRGKMIVMQMDNITLLTCNIFTGLHILVSLIATCTFVTKFWLIKYEQKIHALFSSLSSKRTSCALPGHFPRNLLKTQRS